MARRRRRSRSLRWPLSLLLVAAAVLLYWRFGDALRWQAGLPVERPPPRPDDALRVVSWNLANFPSKQQDLTRMRARIAELSADVLALQEVKDEAAVRELLPEHELALSERGGSGGQKLAIAWDGARVELVGSPTEHAELAMGGRVRPAFHAYLRGRASGPDFHVVVVHLKAKPDGQALRREQWPLLREVVGALAPADEDVLVLGDFNAVGGEERDAAAERSALEAALAPAGVRRLPSAHGCSAYWDGPVRDAWREPSLLDLVFVGGLAEAELAEAEALSLTHCARHRCEPFRSTDAYPELDYETLSDHCPVAVDLRVGDDD